jgi:hypothetical protein
MSNAVATSPAIRDALPIRLSHVVSHLSTQVGEYFAALLAEPGGSRRKVALLARSRIHISMFVNRNRHTLQVASERANPKW